MTSSWQNLSHDSGSVLIGLSPSTRPYLFLGAYPIAVVIGLRWCDKDHGIVHKGCEEVFILQKCRSPRSRNHTSSCRSLGTRYTNERYAKLPPGRAGLETMITSTCVCLNFLMVKERSKRYHRFTVSTQTSHSSSRSYAVCLSHSFETLLTSGFQHSLAMLAGVIPPPIIFASQLGLSRDYQSYLISASLIASGILSMVQMSRFKIPKTNYYIGTGLITVVGTSFASLSTGTAVFNALYADGTCPSTVNAQGTVVRGPCPEQVYLVC